MFRSMEQGVPSLQGKNQVHEHNSSSFTFFVAMSDIGGVRPVDP